MVEEIPKDLEKEVTEDLENLSEKVKKDTEELTEIFNLKI